MKRIISTATAFMLVMAFPVSAAQAKAKPTALCKDGTYSYSANRKGTCSHHKGVKVWYK